MNKPSTASVRFAGVTQHRFLSCLFAGIVSFALFALSTLIVLTMIAYQNADPTRQIAPFAYIALCLSTFISGFTSGKMRGRQGALTGMAEGTLVALLLTLVSLILHSDMLTSSPLFALGLYVAIIGISSLGGAMGGSRPKSRKKKRHSANRRR